jgi:4-hydroxy-3-polyprenylbenzoate decarboxylase
MKNIVLGISGASGARYARRLAQILATADAHVHLVVTPPGRRVLADELGLHDFSVEGLIGRAAPNVTTYAHDDVGAAIASGSFPTVGMIVCPCSGRTLGAIANGLSDNLLTRAALVTLKEARKLVLVVREMPLSTVEISNMLRVAQAGGVICPACPGFYLNPQTVDDLVDFVVGRVLDLFGLPHSLKTQWLSGRGR